MSYNYNDEQARRAQAARNAQWASNSSQPQNLAPYQTGGYANLNEPTIHTTGTVPMNLLNTPSSHSVIPDVPHNPAPLPLTYQSPTRQQDSQRTVLGNTTYDQGGSSRGPPDVGYGAQSRSYYGQAPQNPGLGPSGSSQRPPDVGYGAQPPNYYGQAPQNPGLGPSGSSRGPPSVGYGAQPPNYYPQAPPNPGSEPSGSQTAQMQTRGPMSYLVDRQGGRSERCGEQEMQKKERAEKKKNGICTYPSCRNLPDPGKTMCEVHLGDSRQRYGALRDRKRAEGKCYEGGCNEPAAAPGKKCQQHIDAKRAYYERKK